MSALETAMLRALRDAIRPVRGQMRGMIRRGTLGSLDTTKKLQSAQVGTLKDDDDDGVEVFESYGFTSAPEKGAEGLVLRVGGERAGSVAILFGDREVRVQVERGEVAMYHKDGASVLMKNDGNIVLTHKPGSVVQLGDDTASLEVARRTDPVSVPSIASLQTAIQGWVPVANDGGAALKTALATWLGLTNPQNGTITAGGTGSVST